MNKETKTEIVILRTTPAEKKIILRAGRVLHGMSGLVRTVIVPAANTILTLAAKDAK